MLVLSTLSLGLAVHTGIPSASSSAASRAAIRLQFRDSPSSSTLERPASGSSSPSPVAGISAQMADVRAQMEQDESTAAMMQALRGSNMNDDDNAAAGTTMQVVEMRRGEGDDTLPTDYNPEALSAYFNKRPGAVLTRLLQIATASGGWVASVVFDAVRGELSSGSDAEVAAVARLREVLVSLGPFFIKLGQALSIRPDILSPQAMVQLQQLCDKVPPFDSVLAMETIREDLGCKQISDVYSKITPEPVAAASLGQVYQATLKDSGDEVAVKVQRPFVLETVSLDLHLVRLLGLAARNTPLASKLDIVDLLDEFAANFYQELDYELECANGIRVAEEMKNIPRVKVTARLQATHLLSLVPSRRRPPASPPTHPTLVPPASLPTHPPPHPAPSPSSPPLTRRAFERLSCASRSRQTTPNSPPAACTRPSGWWARSSRSRRRTTWASWSTSA